MTTESAPSRQAWLAGEAFESPSTLDVQRKDTGETISQVPVGDREAVVGAIAAAHDARTSMANWPKDHRSGALHRVAEGIENSRAEFERVLALEAGKPLQAARVEVDRAIETFRIAGEEATRTGGEVMPIEHSERSRRMEAIVRREPTGACSLITPFNFPLNLAAHKIGPALAAGCPFVLKPDPRTPLTTLMLGPLLATAGIPEGGFSILPIVDDAARDLLVTDDRPRLVSFTGSTTVGWSIRSRAGTKRVILELGGIAPAIVDRGVDLDHAANRITAGAYGFAGQSCISVQRVLVHEDDEDPMIERLASRASNLTRGDLLDPSTAIGPLIEVGQAERVERWIGEAVDHGAELVCGGTRDGAFIEPTLIRGAPGGVNLSCEEVFGPVAVVETYTSFDQALQMANATRYGLQAGVFTPSLDHALRAWRELEFGGVVINDIPTTRVDSMPYGGIKDSGLGREGLRFAIEEMTEMRTLVLRMPE